MFCLLQLLSTLATGNGGTLCTSPRPHRYALYSRFNDDAAAILEACNWPPPLLGAPASKQSNTSGTAEPPAQGPDAADAAEQPADLSAASQPQSKPTFTGFDQLEPSKLAALLSVLACLTSLQQACDRQGFAAVQALAQNPEGAQSMGDDSAAAVHAAFVDTPVLWAATALVAPLQARMLAHFDPQQPAGDIRRPANWLYKVALSLVKVRIRFVIPLPHTKARQCGAVGCMRTPMLYACPCTSMFNW